ncbi:hypothetical protein CsSME_00052934 [Camellia sinensis var. sinensis]
MAAETLEDKKQEEIANVEDKGEVKEEGKAEEGEEEKEAEKQGEDTEMEEEKEEEEEEKEEPEVKGEESKEEVEEVSKKAKRGRKGSSKKAAKDEKAAKSEPGSKEPVTPIERPIRERKTVERYSEPSTGRSASKVLSIEKGQGTQLKDIPNVAFKLSKRKPDDSLQMLHTILFGKKTKSHSLKKNIGLFSGYVWVENEEKQRAKIKEKLDKCVKEKLLDFCDVLNIPIIKAITKKEEISAKLLEFLESPHPTTDTLLADKEQKGKKRKGKTTASRTAISGEASEEAPVKKRKKTPQVGENRKRSSKTEEDEVEPADTKNESQDDDDVDNDNTVPKEESDQEGSESEEEEEDETKEQAPIEKKSPTKNVKKESGSKASEKSKSVKKGTPAKSSITSAKSTKNSSSSTSMKAASNADGASESASKPKVSATKKQKGKASKKAKPEPSKEEMHAVVVNILKEVDFNTATLSDILRQLGTHFGVDLMHRKAEVKAVITDVINSMSDEEDEGEEADSGDDAKKDEDSDSDA